MYEQREAVQKRGRDLAADIRRVVRDLLIDEAGTKLSYRAVAERLGLYVRNVSYYFPSKAALIAGGMDEIRADFDRRLEALLTKVGPDPANCLTAVIAFYIDEIAQPDRRRIGMRIRHHLYEVDGFTGRFLREQLGLPFVARFKPLIMSCAPDLDEGEADLRAQLVAAMIEGLAFLAADADDPSRSAQFADLVLRCQAEALRVACSSPTRGSYLD